MPIMSHTHESQCEMTNRMYDDRAKDYDSSWHPAYSERFMRIANVQAGHRILDLACGTGLEAVLAAQQVGDTGKIVCVDASQKMLDQFNLKLERDAALAKVVRLQRHDVTDLPSCPCPEIRRGYFDLILCSNAFVLFRDAAKVIEQWRQYLKPGGRMVIDIPHEQSHRQGPMMETVAERLDFPLPCYRRWITSQDSFKQLLEEHGMLVEQVETVDNAAGKGLTYLDVSQADEQFDFVMSIPLFAPMATDDFKVKARRLFREEWAKAAEHGKVIFHDILYVYVARKV